MKKADIKFFPFLRNSFPKKACVKILAIKLGKRSFWKQPIQFGNYYHRIFFFKKSLLLDTILVLSVPLE